MKANLAFHFSLVLWLLAAGLWLVLFFFNPYTSAATITLPGLAMLLTAVFGSCAAAKASAQALLWTALLSLPIGLYVLGSPGIFAAIGVLNLLNLALAIGLLATRAGRRAQGPAVDQ